MLVRYNQKNMISAKAKGKWIRFVPGINEVSSENWQSLIENKNFKKNVDKGLLVVVGDQESDDMSGALSKVDGVVEAKNMVRETFDIRLLKQWQSEEKRKTVLQVIDEQLEKIENQTKAN